MTNVVILGAGPAGSGLAWRLARRGFDVTVVERAAVLGGNAGSFELEGQRVDYGSHRLHPSCAPEILADIRAMLGPDLLDRPRHGRIRLRGRWLHFPLKPLDLALHAHPSFAAGVVRDALWKSRRLSSEETFASVLEQGLGPTICRDFYFPYARKIWGREPGDLDAEQARRRVSAGSMARLLKKVIAGKGGARFYYPRRGFGQITDAYAQAASRAGARFLMQTSLASLEAENGRMTGITVSGDSGERRIQADQIFSTIPIPALARLAGASASGEVLESAAALRYRAMILVYLVLDTDRFSEYDAHYFPEARVAVTRISEPKNYSLAGIPGLTVLCAELPCDRDGEIWNMPDGELGRLALDALAEAGLAVKCSIRRLAARRLPQAYPIYTRDYRTHFARLDAWAGSLDGLVTLGRQGLFAHDNTHHTLAMAYAAADCLAGDGRFDGARWAQARSAFEQFVVED